MIVLYAIVQAVQVDDPENPVHGFLEKVFSVFFMCEVLIRLAGRPADHGPLLKDYALLLDTAVVAITASFLWGTMILEYFDLEIETDKVSVIAILRLIRLTRLMRMRMFLTTPLAR